MAVVVLAATAVVADSSVAGGMSPLVSRTEVSAGQCLDGDSIDHAPCPSGPPVPPTTADVSSREEASSPEANEEIGLVLLGDEQQGLS